NEVLFTWHGGEPLMRPISFYKKALDLQRVYGRGRQIDNSIQTNGTLLTDEWCIFLKENNFLVGISIDGPQEFHDEYRRNKQGLPSFYKVKKGIELLKKHGVEYNAMAVVNDYNVDYPLEFYNFFKEIDCHYIQFSPIVERITEQTKGTKLTHPQQQNKEIKLAPFSVDAEKWGDFLCAIFDEWIKEDVGNYYIQLFDATLANWVGQQPGVCTLAKTCGHAGVLEFNGDVYSCDHYVFPEYKLGNIRTHSLTEMMYSPKQLKFGNDKADALPGQCKACEYLFACNGECPKNRFLITSDGEPGLNYLCIGLKKYFAHVAPYMDFMKRELLAQRPPANVMEWAREQRQ
ncbi:MAG: anaerobic sulfatase-maturation protein, partial [Parabacteroides sp.]|nr:anaerobic sulfatase-maturation protein [Parabacteroides sp.]